MGTHIIINKRTEQEGTKFTISKFLFKHNLHLTLLMGIFVLVAIFLRFINGNTGNPTEWDHDANLLAFTIIAGGSTILIIITTLISMVFTYVVYKGYTIKSIQRQVHLIGLIGIYIGLVIYCGGLFFEPIIIYYLITIITLYIIFLRIFQPSMLPYITNPGSSYTSATVIGNNPVIISSGFYSNMPWDARTINVVQTFGQTGNFDIYMGIILLLIFILAYLVIKSPHELISKPMKDRLLNDDSLHARFKYLIYFFGIFYVLLWLQANPLATVALMLLILTLLLRYSVKIAEVLFSPNSFRFIIRRVLLVIPMFLGMSVIIFLLFSVFSGGNPLNVSVGYVEHVCNGNNGCVAYYLNFLNMKFGLDSSIQLQWFNFVFQFLVGNVIVINYHYQAFITNITLNYFFPGVQDIINALISSLELAILPTLLAVLLAILFEKLLLKRKNYFSNISSPSSNLLRNIFSIFLIFLTIVVYFIANYFPILPFGNQVSNSCGIINGSYPACFIGSNLLSAKLWLNIPLLQDLIAPSRWDWISHLVFPLFILTFLETIFFIRLIHDNIAKIVKQNYILNARTSGYSEAILLNKYLWKNMLISLIPSIGFVITYLLILSPITETIMGWPGLGLYGFNILFNHLDYRVSFPNIMTYPLGLIIMMIIGLAVIFTNLLVDIAYVFIHPNPITAKTSDIDNLKSYEEQITD